MVVTGQIMSPLIERELLGIQSGREGKKQEKDGGGGGGGGGKERKIERDVSIFLPNNTSLVIFFFLISRNETTFTTCLFPLCMQLAQAMLEQEGSQSHTPFWAYSANGHGFDFKNSGLQAHRGLHRAQRIPRRQPRVEGGKILA
ncbi:hypothetical protein ACJX0J_008342 [Zea mays]